MKNKILIFISFVIVFVVVAQIMKNRPQPISDSEVDNLGKAVEAAFQPRQAQPAQTSTQANTQGESIIAVIYRRDDATWFIKGRGKTQLVQANGGEFGHLFLQQQKFNEQGQPDFSHVPEKYRVKSQQSMRFATFNLKGLEVSVTRLSADQSVDANINRWRNQLNLPASAPQFVRYQDDDKTVLVRLDQGSGANTAQQSQPQAPAKEELTSFLKLPESEQWQMQSSQAGMASGTIALAVDGQSFPVAVLRLPGSVPVDTIMGIWKERLGLAADAPVASKTLTSNAGQNWRLLNMQSDKSSLKIAMHKGQTRYTFLRLTHDESTPDSVTETFEKMVQQVEIIKD